jgi:hypothetical protein
MRVVAVAVLGLGLGWSASVAAAQKAKPAVEPPMQVHLVRSARPGCEPSCPEWIAAQGRIETGSVARFRSVLRRLGRRKVPVLVDSSGGKVRQAFAIGRLLRSRGLDVAVTRTVFTPCAPRDKRCLKAKTGGMLTGLPQARLSKCASACAFILAGGNRRLVGADTFVGVHRIRSFYVYTRVLRTYRMTGNRKRRVRRVARRMVETRTPKRVYDQIGRYFAEMGIGDPVLPRILSTPSDSLHWLSRDELRTSGLATDWIDGERLLSDPAVPAPLPAQPPASSPAAPAASPPASPPRAAGLGG